MKVYPSYDVAAMTTGVSRSTFFDTLWEAVYILDECLDEIDFNRRFDQKFPSGIFAGCLSIIDGTKCKLNRPNEEIQELFYSGKKKMHTMKYEVGVSIDLGHIIWISGPYPGKVHDSTMYKDGGIGDHLIPNELVLGDKGYRGNQRINWCISSVRITVERAIQ
eukprot:TRINITY_DN7174_c0_g1_i2.p1 TRINITY_DN7174_c0_g1~~TRINITY_DN7174_c0_g1_i2.p1  ORF type:complete len:163 (-),score=20.18 TRINITY_DN7174_c0_g1_i2:166-654(-)